MQPDMRSILVTIVGVLLILFIAVRMWQEQEKTEQRIAEWLNYCTSDITPPGESWFPVKESSPGPGREEMKELFAPIVIRHRLAGEAPLMRLEVLLPGWPSADQRLPAHHQNAEFFVGSGLTEKNSPP